MRTEIGDCNDCRFWIAIADRRLRLPMADLAHQIAIIIQIAKRQSSKSSTSIDNRQSQSPIVDQQIGSRQSEIRIQ
jgi:hypothetical protein